MDVERTDPRQIEEFLREYASIRRKRKAIESFASQLAGKRSKSHGIVDAQTEVERRAFHGTRRQTLASARGPVGLRNDTHELRPRCDGVQARHGERARPKEEASHTSAASSSSSVATGRRFVARSI